MDDYAVFHVPCRQLFFCPGSINLCPISLPQTVVAAFFMKEGPCAPGMDVSTLENTSQDK